MIINHDIRSVNGKYIQMPAWKSGQACGDAGWKNLAIPSPYEIDTVARYPIGTRFVDDDRVWRYAYAGGTCTTGYAAAAFNKFSTGTTQETATIAAAGSDGDTTISCTTQGTVTADLFAGGYFLVYWEFQCYRIESNTATSGTTFIITMDNPLDQDISGSSVVTVYKDKYTDCRRLTSGEQAGFAGVVGVPHKTITSGAYGWLQTWGPAAVAGTDNIGETPGERGLYAMHDGSVFCTTGIHGSNNQPAYQYLGYAVGYTGTAVGGTGLDFQGAHIYIELQIAP